MKFSRKTLFAVVVTNFIIVSGILLLLVSRAHALNLFNISDTLSTSQPGAGAVHTISFLSNSPITANETIQVVFDPATNAFGGVQNVATSDVQLTGATLVSSCVPGSNRVILATSTSALTFTVCAGNTVPSGTIVIAVNNNRITNPTSIQSYVIRLTGTMPATGDTRVAITPAVAVTAAIATTFSFTITGDATGTVINNVTTTGSCASTSLSFGMLSPLVPEILGQQLQVTTNASNGFAVTVHEDQPLTSSNGDTIGQFYNGNATSTPSPWLPPSGLIGQTNTYGQFGVTSDDASGTLNFGTSTPLFAGSFNPTSTLTVFSWAGPSDGMTQNAGKASVAYEIEVTPLQAAGNNYTNNLIYVATPVF
jgi:hypothetical protein